MICPDIFCKENVLANKSDNGGKTVDEHNLASFCETHDVCLQIFPMNCILREKIIRVIVYTATNRNDIRTDITRELGYVSLGELEVSHSLFGGIKSECNIHNIFKIHVKNLICTRVSRQ